MVDELTILVVDDYLDALDVWEMYLRTEGFNVLTAADGHRALATATAALPDLIVMDLDLPGLSGIEIARDLRSRLATRHIPLIAATGHSDVAQLDRARQAGFDAVIMKPCDPSMLLVEIRRLLAAPKLGRGGESDST
jgi:two-component system cell cycle response regulator DivK